MKIFRSIVIGFLLLWGITDTSAAPGEWTATITISTPYSSVPGGVMSIPLSAGVREGATTGYDNGTDTVSFLESDDPLQSHFSHGAIITDPNADGIPDGWDCPDPEVGYNAYQCSLWRDFRGLRETETWAFEVISLINGATVSLDVRVESDPASLAGMELSLVDMSATPPLPPIPLNQNTSRYSYTNVFTSGKGYDLRKFEVRLKTTGLLVVPSSLPPGALLSPYSQVLRTVNGGGVMWSVEEGDLPPGLRLDAASGQIEGVPLLEGVFPFTVRADDPVTGLSVSHEFSLIIHPPLLITTLELPGGEIRAAYSQILGVSGGTPPFTWSVISGSLPEGISLNRQDGRIEGIFQVPGIFDFTVQVKDAGGVESIQPYRIVVVEPADAAPPTAISDLKVLYATATSAILTWSAPSDDSLTGTAAAYDLRYSENCPIGDDATWWNAALQASGEPRPQAGAVHTYTLGGFQGGKHYCAAIRSVDASGRISALSNKIRFPEGTTLEGDSPSGLVARQVSLFKGYNLISIPLVPLPNDLSIFEDDVGSPATLYRWYSAYPGLTETRWYLEEGVWPGYGYFLFASESGIVLDVTGLTVQDPQYMVPLHGGWNMIGNPFDGEILLKDVLVRKIPEKGGEEIRTFEEAAAAGWVGNALYTFTGLGYEFLAVNDDSPAALNPGVGFWLYAKEEGTYEMIFNKP